MGQVIKLFNNDEFITFKNGTKVNISEFRRIHRAVWAQVRPGMTDKDLDRIIENTVARMKPN